MTTKKTKSAKCVYCKTRTAYAILIVDQKPTRMRAYWCGKCKPYKLPIQKRFSTN